MTIWDYIAWGLLIALIIFWIIAVFTPQKPYVRPIFPRDDARVPREDRKAEV